MEAIEDLFYSNYKGFFAQIIFSRQIIAGVAIEVFAFDVKGSNDIAL
jgi:hypothetical protein